MRGLAVILLGIICPLFIQAQSMQWAFGIGKSTNWPGTKGYSITTDNLNNILVTGSFDGTVDLDPGPDSAIFFSQSQDIFVAKYNQQGQYIWGFALGGVVSDEGRVIKCDKNNNVYVGGNFYHKVDFDPSPDTFFLSGEFKGKEIFIAKYDSVGKFSWAIGFGGIVDDNLFDFALDTGGNIYATGQFSYDVDFDPSSDTAFIHAKNDDLFFAKYYTNGKFGWVKHIGGNGEEYGRKILLDKQGNIILSGCFGPGYDSIDFNPSPIASFYIKLNSPAYQDIFLAKYDTSGSFIWAKKLGGKNEDRVWGMSLCLNEDILLSGDFRDTADFDPSHNTFYLYAFIDKVYNMDSFLARYDSSGNFIWATSIKGKGKEYGGTVYEDISGYIINTITFEDSLNLGSLTNPLWMKPYGNNDELIATYSPGGNLLGAVNIGGVSSNVYSYSSVIKQGSLFIAGYFNGNVDFDPSAGIHILSSTGGSVFIAKYILNVGIKEFASENCKLLIYPNPVNDQITISAKDENALPEGVLQILGIQGNKAKEVVIPKYQQSLQVNLSDLQPGLYLGRIVGKNGESVGFKIIKN